MSTECVSRLRAALTSTSSRHLFAGTRDCVSSSVIRRAYVRACLNRRLTAVRTRILQTLGDTYSFANRDFGQGVSADEVAAVIQAVPGVIAVNVKSIYKAARPWNSGPPMPRGPP